MLKDPLSIRNTYKMLSISCHNSVKMSAAGSGKTYDTCKNALEMAKSGKKVLITTYTNRGAESVRKEIKKQNEGVLHPFVVVKTWYSFLLADMIKPYQRYLTGRIGGIKTFDYSQTFGYINYAKAGTKEKYITPEKKVRSNEGASLVCLLNQLSDGKVIHRLAEIYHAIYFDEIQDLAGDDITIIKLLIDSSIIVVCCGDNKQATFSTHNAKKNKKMTGKNIWVFFEELEKKGLVEVERNLCSRRFNRQICCFANSVFPFGDPITTNMSIDTMHDGVFLIDASNVGEYMSTYSPQVLRYDKNTDTYGYRPVNFGACKGETFDRVLIVPNSLFIKLITKGIPLSAPEKYYVAVTRPRFSIAIVLAKLPDIVSGYEKVMITCGKTQIRGLKYIALN